MTKPLLALLLLLMLLFAGSVRADENHQALVSGGRAYLFRLPERIAPGEVGKTSVSPDGATLLFAQSVTGGGGFNALSQTEADVFPDSSVMLYGAGRDKPVVLWKSANTATDWRFVDEIDWLAGGETAMVRVKHGHADDKGEYLFGADLLIVNVRRQTARFVTLTEPDDGDSVFLHPSPTRPEALLIVYGYANEPRTPDKIRARAEKVYFLNANGLGTLMHTTESFLTFEGWSATGTEAFGYEYAGEMRPGNEKYLSLDLRSKKVRHVKQQNIAPPPVTPAPPAPILMRGERGKLASGNLRRGSDLLIAENAEGTERVIVAADAKPVTIIADKWSRKLIYQTPGGLFAVPVQSRPYAEYGAIMRVLIEASAHAVYNALYQWREENGVETFPSGGDPLVLLVGADKLADDDALRDPRTGALAFRNLDTGKPDASGNVPTFALQTVFGKITFYATGDGPAPVTVWDTPEPPAKP